MHNKTICCNIIISFALFAAIFYSKAGVSGGDMAIVAFNIMAGLIHIAVASVYFRLKKVKGLSSVNLAIILSQVTEIAIFATWGHPINEFIKNFKH